MRLETGFSEESLYLIVKHNTNKSVYKFNIHPERFKTFFRIPVIEFPQSASFGEYTFYVTSDNIDISDISIIIPETVVSETYYILNREDYLKNGDSYLVNGVNCTRRIRILKDGLLMRHNEKVIYTRYGERRVYKEYDKTRK